MKTTTQSVTPIKILFCDIDDTLTTTISGHKFKQHPKDVKPLPGAVEAVKKYAADGYKVFGVSNQGGIEAGFKTLENTIAEMQYTLELFPELERILFCPNFAGSECKVIYKRDKIMCLGYYIEDLERLCKKGINFRKPSPGMPEIIMALEDKNLDFSGIDYKNSLFVGDRPEDKECAENANIPFKWVEEWLIPFWAKIP